MLPTIARSRRADKSWKRFSQMSLAKHWDLSHSIVATTLCYPPRRDSPGTTSKLAGAFRFKSLEVTRAPFCHFQGTINVAPYLTVLASAGVSSICCPGAIRLCVFVDRGLRELPVQADYVGRFIPTSRRERIKVSLAAQAALSDEVAILAHAP